MSRPGQENHHHHPPDEQPDRFGRRAAAVATVLGLLVALLALPASATWNHDGTTTTGKATTPTYGCDDDSAGGYDDKPGASPHMTLTARRKSGTNRLKIYAVLRVENTYYDSSVDTWPAAARATAFGYCNSLKSVEVWYTTASGNSRSNLSSARGILNKYKSGGTQANARNPVAADTDGSADQVERMQYNLLIPEGYSMGSTIMHFQGAGAVTVDTFPDYRWVCAIVRVNTGRVTITSSGTTTAVANGDSVSNADGPAKADQRGDFGEALCVSTRSSDGEKLQDQYNHD